MISVFDSKASLSRHIKKDILHEVSFIRVENVVQKAYISYIPLVAQWIEQSRPKGKI